MTDTIVYATLSRDFPISRVLYELVNSDQHKHKSTRTIADAIGISHMVIARLRHEPYLPAEEATIKLLNYLLPQGSCLAIVKQSNAPFYVNKDH